MTDGNSGHVKDTAKGHGDRVRTSIGSACKLVQGRHIDARGMV